MDHQDIVILICSFLDDIDKFLFLSISKKYDSLKEKIWFHERVHLFRIYAHKYYNQFTNVIVCKKIKNCVDSSGRLVKTRRIIFPSNVKKVEFLDNINHILPDGITHLKPHYSKYDEIPQSVTHLNATNKRYYGRISIKNDNLPKQLKCLRAKFDIADNELPDKLTHYINDSCKQMHIVPQDIQYLSGSYTSIPENISYLVCTQHINYHLDINNPLYIKNYHFLHIGLKKLSLIYYDPNIGSLSHLLNLETLIIGYLQNDINDELPPNITCLKIGRHYDKQVMIKNLPLSLKSLYIGRFIDIDNLNLPNLTHLSTVANNNPGLSLIPNLSHLQINYDYKYASVNIPSTVRYLKLAKFNRVFITKTTIPSLITHLTFDNCFNKTIKNRIPFGVTHLSFGRDFYRALIINDIPSSITHLTLSSKCYTLNKDSIRNRDISIKMVHVYDKDPFIFNEFEKIERYIDY